MFDAYGKLLYSTYLGGSELDGEVNPNGDFVDNSTNGNNIAVDARGLVISAGTTMSRGGPAPAIKFPITGNAIQPDMKGDKNVGRLPMYPRSSRGRLGLAALLQLPRGQRERKGTQRCGKRHRQRHCRGGLHQFLGLSDDPQRLSERPPPQFQSNGFVAQFRAGQYCRASVYCRYTTQYSTYLGGILKVPRDDTYGVTIDSRGLILATGRTQSADFPMTTPYGRSSSIYNSAPYLQPGKSNDQPYLVKIDPSLIGKASLTYSTFLGGGGFCTGVAVDFNRQCLGCRRE